MIPVMPESSQWVSMTATSNHAPLQMPSAFLSPAAASPSCWNLSPRQAAATLGSARAVADAQGPLTPFRSSPAEGTLPFWGAALPPLSPLPVFTSVGSAAVPFAPPAQATLGDPWSFEAVSLGAPTSMPKILSIDEWWAQHGAPAALDLAVGIGTDTTAGGTQAPESASQETAVTDKLAAFQAAAQRSASKWALAEKAAIRKAVAEKAVVEQEEAIIDRVKTNESKMEEAVVTATQTVEVPISEPMVVEQAEAVIIPLLAANSERPSHEKKTRLDSLDDVDELGPFAAALREFEVRATQQPCAAESTDVIYDAARQKKDAEIQQLNSKLEEMNSMKRKLREEMAMLKSEFSNMAELRDAAAPGSGVQKKQDAAVPRTGKRPLPMPVRALPKRDNARSQSHTKSPQSGVGDCSSQPSIVSSDFVKAGKPTPDPSTPTKRLLKSHETTEKGVLAQSSLTKTILLTDEGKKPLAPSAVAAAEAETPQYAAVDEAVRKVMVLLLGLAPNTPVQISEDWWVACSETGHAYYKNSVTNATSWTYPECLLNSRASQPASPKKKCGTNKAKGSLAATIADENAAPTVHENSCPRTALKTNIGEIVHKQVLQSGQARERSRSPLKRVGNDAKRDVPRDSESVAQAAKRKRTHTTSPPREAVKSVSHLMALAQAATDLENKLLGRVMAEAKHGTLAGNCKDNEVKPQIYKASAAAPKLIKRVDIERKIAATLKTRSAVERKTDTTASVVLEKVEDAVCNRNEVKRKGAKNAFAVCSKLEDADDAKQKKAKNAFEVSAKLEVGGCKIGKRSSLGGA